MRSRLLAASLLTLAFSAAACQVIWSYDDFKDQPGTGGSVTRTSASSSSSSGGGSSSSVGTGGTSSSDDGGCEGGPLGGACTDPCDVTAVLAHQGSIQPDVYACTVQAAGGPNPSCVAKMDDLTMACAVCWAALGPCGALHCAQYCITGDVNAVGCNDCLAEQCDCAFTACSGTVRPAEVDAGVDASCD